MIIFFIIDFIKIKYKNFLSVVKMELDVENICFLYSFFSLAHCLTIRLKFHCKMSPIIRSGPISKT